MALIRWDRFGMSLLGRGRFPFDFEGGVLTVHVPNAKTEKRKTRQIKIE
jgi:hypothetical protein